MREIITWVKWKTYIRWKNMWSSFFFFKGKWSSSFGVAALIFDTVQAIFYIVAYYTLFQFIILNRSISNLQMDGVFTSYLVKILSEVQDSTLYLWNMYFLIVFIYCMYVGMKSSRWSQFASDRELLQNFVANKYVELFLFIESITWNFRLFLLRLVSLGVVLTIVTEQPIFHAILLFIILVVLYILICLFFAIMHYFYILYRSYIVNKYVFIFQQMLFKLLSVFLGFLLSNQLYGWIKQAPFLTPNFTSDQLRNWLDHGVEKVGSSLLFLIEDRRLPYNYLSYKIYNSELLLPLIGLIIGVFLIVLFLVQTKKYLSNFDGYHHRDVDNSVMSVLEDIHSKILFRMKLFERISNYFKLFYRSPVVLKKINHITGDAVYWFIIGVFSGLLADSDISSKVNLLIIYILIYFHVYFFYENFYNAFKGVLSLDSEGENAFLYLYAKNNLWHLLKMKMLVALTYATLIILAGDVVIFILTGIPLEVFIWIVLNHLTILLLFGIMQFIPSVYHPHFTFFNIEQLEDFSDKRISSSAINLGTVGIVIPAFMIPCVLHLVDSINLTEVYILNIFILIVILLVSLSILVLLKNKLKKRNFITRR